MATTKSAQLTVIEDTDDEEVEDEITIRPITTRDLFTVIKHVVPKIDIIRIRELFNSAPQDENSRDMYYRTAGIEMILMVINATTDEKIQAWIADLAGLTLEQFLDSDIKTSFKIVNAIAQNEDIRNVFTTLLR